MFKQITTAPPGESITINKTIPSKQFEELKKENLELFKELFPNEPKTPTPLEQVKKEWEEKGYKWIEDKIFITLINKKYDKCIKINKKLKDYKSYDLFMTPTLLHTNNIALFITFQEHQLLTKTFRALRWFND